MKKLKLILLFIILFFICTCNCYAKEDIKIYFFHGDGCPHCKEEGKYLEKLKKEYKDIDIVKFEVWNNKDNQELMELVKKKMEIKETGVPLTIIGSTYVVGYTETYNDKFNRIINFYLDNKNKYFDVVGSIKNNTYNGEKIVDQFEIEDKKTDKDTTVTIPIMGKINLKNFSIEVAAVLIGLIDGFNPCAMWVLLFLISMLLGMKNRKRMWIIGLTFLFASAFIYMAIMLSWVNVVVNIGTSILFRNIIAVIAIIGSIINIKSFINELKKDSGCQVIDAKKRKKIFSKIKKFTTEKNLLLALIGVILLAISVNIVELACSAGLPLIFTQILTINKIHGILSFYYIFIYIVNFLFKCTFFIFSAVTFGIHRGNIKIIQGRVFEFILILVLFFIPFTIFFSNKVLLYLLFILKIVIIYFRILAYERILLL